MASFNDMPNLSKKESDIDESLAKNDTGDLILRETWPVLPSIYWNIAANCTHAGHLGLTKTKALLRPKVFFPKMEETITSQCTSYKFVTPSHGRHKLLAQ